MIHNRSNFIGRYFSILHTKQVSNYEYCKCSNFADFLPSGSILPTPAKQKHRAENKQFTLDAG